VSRAITPNALALQQLREELHPSLLQLYPELLTATAAPPTRREVIEVLEQLDALSSLTGISNTALFAMDVIGSLVAMIDVDQLEPGAPRQTCVESDALTDNMVEIDREICITNEQIK
jgi:hypothetical protein